MPFTMSIFPNISFIRLSCDWPYLFYLGTRNLWV